MSSLLMSGARWGHQTTKGRVNDVWMEVGCLRWTPHTNSVHNSALLHPWDIQWVVHRQTHWDAHKQKKTDECAQMLPLQKKALLSSKVWVHERITKPRDTRANGQMSFYRHTKAREKERETSGVFFKQKSTNESNESHSTITQNFTQIFSDRSQSEPWRYRIKRTICIVDGKTKQTGKTRA